MVQNKTNTSAYTESQVDPKFTDKQLKGEGRMKSKPNAQVRFRLSKRDMRKSINEGKTKEFLQKEEVLNSKLREEREKALKENEMKEEVENSKQDKEVDLNDKFKDRKWPIYENELDYLVATSQGKSERRDYTATHITVKVHNKPIHSLADSGASHSIIAWSWLKYLGCEKMMKKSEVTLMDAQKGEIPVMGEVILPVEVGNGTFDWSFIVARELFSPMILGVDNLNTGKINFKKRKLKIHGQQVPITFTLDEASSHTVVAAMNKVIPANEIVKIKGRVIRTELPHKLSPQNYVVKTGGMLVDGLLVQSKIGEVHHKGKEGEEVEKVTLIAMNLSDKPRQITKGEILAILNAISIETI